jgi:hypothetical protein
MLAATQFAHIGLMIAAVVLATGTTTYLLDRWRSGGVLWWPSTAWPAGGVAPQMALSCAIPTSIATTCPRCRPS